MAHRSRSVPTDLKSANLSSDFGYAYAVRLFGQETIDSLPVLKAGKNKGKPKGHVLWLKTRAAGYCVYVGGGAPAGMVVRAWLGAGAFTPEDDALQAMWVGRVQSVCGSRCCLGEKNRERMLAERAREEEDRARQYGELRAEAAADRAAARLLGA